MAVIFPQSSYLAKAVPRCMVINARSLEKPDAASSLHADLHSNKVDLCFVSETWLNDEIPPNLMCPNGYILIGKDRFGSRIGGGVAIICRNDSHVNTGPRLCLSRVVNK